MDLDLDLASREEDRSEQKSRSLQNIVQKIDLDVDLDVHVLSIAFPHIESRSRCTGVNRPEALQCSCNDEGETVAHRHVTGMIENVCSEHLGGYLQAIRTRFRMNESRSRSRSIFRCAKHTGLNFVS